MKTHREYIIKERRAKTCWKIIVEDVTKTSVLIKFENLEKPVRMLTTEFELKYEIIETLGITIPSFKLLFTK